MNPGRGKRWLVVVAAVIVVAIVAAVAFWPGERQPEYQGKKLSEWVEMQEDHPGECAEAVTAIGTNAIPLLLSWLDYEIPAWKVAIGKFYVRHERLARRLWVLRRYQGIEPWRRQQAARAGFVILGSRASNGIPALTRLALSTNSQSALFAISSLSYLGEGAVQPLVALSSNRTLAPENRAFAVSAMGNMTYLGTNAAPCIGALVACSKETNLLIAICAKRSLGVFTQPAGVDKSARAGMNWTNAAPNSHLRQLAMRAAINFSTNFDQLIFEIISKGTNDPDPAVRAEAVHYLGAGEERGAGGHD